MSPPFGTSARMRGCMLFTELARLADTSGQLSLAAELRDLANPPAGTVVALVSDELVRWCVGVTSAPANYDGFGTFTLAGHPEGRLVAVEEGSLQWQRTRYGSGLHGYRPATTEETATANEVIMRRITGVNPVE